MAQNQRHISRLLRLSNFSASVDKSGARAQVLLPGFTPDDFDRSGNLSIHRLQRLFTFARMFVYHTPNENTGRSFLEYDVLTSDRFTFMASTKTTVEQSFYTLPDQVKLPKLAININLGYIGGASLNSIAELVDKDSGAVYAKNTNQVVTIDKTTRRPILIPDWWRERYGGHVFGGEKLIVGLLEVPENEKCFKYEMKVSWNDIDRYKHTNYLAYIRFCFDAAMDAANKGYFAKLRDDILLYQAGKMELSYKGESLAGDNLMIRCWENPDNQYLVHFDISRDGKTIFQNSIDFYEPVTI